MQTYDVLIVGGGPAGLNAALLLARSLRSVLVVDAGQPRNAPSRALHGYLTRDGLAPDEFLRIGREEVRRYGAEFVHAEVTDARRLDGERDGQREGDQRAAFEVTLADGRSMRSRKLLLATGIRDELPEVEGARQFFGRGLYYCPYCDGWEHRGQPLAAYGRGSDAVGLALALTTWSGDVTACTDGEPVPDEERAWLADNGVALREDKVARLEGNGVLRRIAFEDGPPLPCRALFFNTTHTQRSHLPRALGCPIDEAGEVVTNHNKSTAIPGLYIAGDADGDVEFIIVAAAEGAVAALAINRELQKAERTARPVGR